MKKLLIILFIFCACRVEGEVLPESFSYARAGAYCTPFGICGAKLAAGRRFRNERWGWGPQLQVTANQIGVAITARLEGLYYFGSWDGGYWGINGGFGAANVRDFEQGKGSYWGPWGTFELVLGKESGNTPKTKKFWQTSLFFLPQGMPIGLSFDCSTGF